MNQNRVLCHGTIAALLTVHLSCAGYDFRPGHGARSGETRSRITPSVHSTLPEGVEKGESFRIRFPAEMSQHDGIAFYFKIAQERGARWVSRLRWMSPGSCIQTLMPDSVSRDHEVLYIKNEEYTGGATEQTFERETERIQFPYVRMLDDLPTILDEMRIWVANHDSKCLFSDKPVDLIGLIHGREAIGVIQGKSEIDLTACSGQPGTQAPPNDETNTENRLTLGDLSTVAEADRVLPKWVGRHVQIAGNDGVTSGILRRYNRQTMSIETEQHRYVDVNVLDAFMIEAQEGTSEPPGPTNDRSKSDELNTDDCQRWAPHGHLL